MPQVETVVFRPRGAVAGLFRGGPKKTVAARFREILIEGPAGTGKSYPVAHWFHQLGKELPANSGARVLWVRQTLQSMRESVQVTYEDKVLIDDSEWRAMLVPRGRRESRRGYNYPGMYIHLGGLDHPERLYSTEWDVVWVEELAEVGLTAWLKFMRALRNNALPFQLLLGTTNTRSQYSWVNKRFPEGVRTAPKGSSGAMLRLLSRHEDNPAIMEWGWVPLDEISASAVELLKERKVVKDGQAPRYLATLAELPEPLLSQLFHGRWVAASGLVWPQYDEGRHIEGEKLHKAADGWRIGSRKLKWFAGSMDFGYSNPGCFGLWGVDDDGHSTLIKEIYRTGWQQEQWAEAIERLHKQFPLTFITADCAEPRFIDYLNSTLSFSKGHKVGTKMRGCDKSKGKIHGLNAVRRALDEDKVSFMPRAARMVSWPDPSINTEDHPTCSTEEFGSYVYPDAELAGTPEAKRKREQSEQPDPTCVDHGCDMLEYWCTAMYGDRTLSYTAPKPKGIPQAFTLDWIETLPVQNA